MNPWTRAYKILLVQDNLTLFKMAITKNIINEDMSMQQQILDKMKQDAYFWKILPMDMIS